MSQTDIAIDNLVKEYLLTKGYTKAALELEQELLKKTNQIDLISTIDSSIDNNIITNKSLSSNTNNNITSTRLLSSISEDLIIGMKTNEYDLYTNSYDSLKSWIINSIDLVKSQLLAICFPIFVHCYIGLIKLNLSEEANIFFNTYFNDHLDYYHNELQLLSTLTSKEQLSSDIFLSSNPFISRVLQTKFQIQITNFAYNLLALYLIQSELVIIASIINNQIIFLKINELQVNNEFQEYISFIELPGYTSGSTDISSSNKPMEDTVSTSTSAILGVPNTAKYIHTLLPQNYQQSLHILNTKDDVIYKDIIDKIIRPPLIISAMMLTNKKRKNNMLEQDQYIDVSKISILKNADVLIKHPINTSTNIIIPEQNNIGNALEPSIIFATITNCYENMTCMDINSTITQIITGHKDNCVRVFRLNQKEKDYFGRHLKQKLDISEWEINEILPKTKKMLSASHTTSNFNTNNLESDNKLPMIELRGHSGTIYGVSQFSFTNHFNHTHTENDLKNDTLNGENFHDDRLVVSCSADETIRLWDTAVSQCVGKYTCVSPSWDVSFNPLGYYFASANQDKSATLYATDRVAPIRLFLGHLSDVNCVAWHSNGMLLATGSDDKVARLWDIRTGNSIRVLLGSSGCLSTIAVSPLGNLLVAGTDNGRLYAWELMKTNRPIAVLQGHMKGTSIHSINFSMDGRSIISGGADCSIKIWSLNDIYENIKNNKSVYNQYNPLNTSSISLSNNKSRYELAPLVIQPYQSYYTKFSPVYYVGYNLQNLAYAGGPFSITSAIASRETNTNVMNTMVSEKDTVNALGISRAISANN